MKYHNLCLDRNVVIPAQCFADDIHDGDEWVVYDNFREDDSALREFPRGEHHRLITHRLEELGVTRPVHAQMNSRCN
jgi:hypothetical protein